MFKEFNQDHETASGIEKGMVIAAMNRSSLIVHIEAEIFHGTSASWQSMFTE